MAEKLKQPIKTEGPSFSLAMGQEKRKHISAEDEVVDDEAFATQHEDLTSESGSEYAADSFFSDSDSEASDTSVPAKHPRIEKVVEPSVGGEVVVENESRPKQKEVRKRSKRKVKCSGVKKVQNVTMKMNCPFVDCSFVTVWHHAMRTHLLGSKHQLDKDDPKCSATAFTSKRMELCRHCGSKERNRCRHEKNSCLQNPESKASLKAKESRRKNKNRGASLLSSVAPRASSSRSIDSEFSKRAPEFRARFKKFIFAATNSLSTLKAKTSKAYYNKFKEIAKFVNVLTI